MFLRFNFKAAVTRSVSGVQISDTSLIDCGISNLFKWQIVEWFLISFRTSFSNSVLVHISSQDPQLIPSKEELTQISKKMA